MQQKLTRCSFRQRHCVAYHHHRASGRWLKEGGLHEQRDRNLAINLEAANARTTAEKGAEMFLQVKLNLPSATVCPKVPLKRNLVVFSALCGWILKPFELQIVLECGFDMMYDMA